MPLIEPITDRTQADADYANAHPDNATPNKGALNFQDLNRIESNCAYLSAQLNAYGYNQSIMVKTNWMVQDFPYQEDIDRIRNNINTLITVYYKLQYSPDIHYWDSLDWNDANSLEQNIKNIDTLLQRMISGFRYSGTFYSGQEVILP
jgi:hypothetical protein